MASRPLEWGLKVGGGVGEEEDLAVAVVVHQGYVQTQKSRTASILWTSGQNKQAVCNAQPVCGTHKSYKAGSSNFFRRKQCAQVRMDTRHRKLIAGSDLDAQKVCSSKQSNKDDQLPSWQEDFACGTCKSWQMRLEADSEMKLGT